MKIPFQVVILKIILAISFSGIFTAEAQLFKKSINAYDDDGQRKGKWISYWDEEESVPMSKAKFKNGREIGVSKEYHINGILRLKFRHAPQRMRVKYYDENRKLESKGWAIMEYNEADTHYYWHGKWKYFNTKRKIERISYYEHGKEMISSIE